MSEAHGRTTRTARAPFDRRLLPYLRPARFALGASVALGLVATASIAAQAVLLARLVASAFPGAPPGESRVAMLAGVAVAATVRGACGLASEVVAQRAATRVKTGLRVALVARTLVVGGPGAGELATIAGRGLDALDVYVGRSLPDLVLAGAAPFVLVAVIAYEDWLSAVVVLVALVLFPVFGALVGKSTGERARARWAEVVTLGDHLVDLFAGLHVLRAYGRTQRERVRVEELGERLRRSSLATLKVAFVSALVLDTLASVSTALVAVPIGIRLVYGAMQLAPGLAALVVTPEVFVPLRRASAEFHESAEGLAAATRALDILAGAAPPSARRIDVPRPVGRPVPPHVVLRSVEVRDPTRRAEPAVLDGVSLEVAAGEIVALVGPNGAGKSTALAVVLGLVTPSSGSVSLDGVELSVIDRDAWRLRCAYLPDRPTILPATLEENLRLAAPSASPRDLAHVVGDTCLERLVARLPDGLATPVGEGGWALSAGERQRVALARALLRDASLYVLDEPTAHLDGETEATIVAAIGRRLDGRSALVVTHRPALLEIADRVVRIERGGVVADLAEPGDRALARTTPS